MIPIMPQKIRQLILICFQFLLLTTPLIWTTTTSELFEFPKMLFVYAMTIIIAGLWLSRMVITQTVIFKKTPLFLPILLFLGSQILSTIFSIDIHTSLFGYYSRFNGGLLSLVSYILLYFAAVSNLDRTDAKKIIFAALFAGIISSLYAFPEHFGHSPSCQVIRGTFTADCWVQDVQTRIFGTFGQPNWLAAYIITIIFIPLLKIRSPFHAVSAILLFLTLLFTKSRSGLIGFGIGLTVFYGLQYVSPKPKKQLALELTSVLISILVLFLLFGRGVSATTDKVFTLFASPTPTPPSAAIETAPANSLDINITPSSKIRQIVWQGAWELTKKYPLFGSGVETFAYSYYNVRPVEHNLVTEWDFLYNKAHNEFLNYAATTGFVGLGAYLFFLASFVLFALKTIRSDRQIVSSSDRSEEKSKHSVKRSNDLTISLYLIALLSGFIALNISNFFGFSTVPVQLLLFLFPAVGYLLVSKPQPPFPDRQLGSSHYILLAVIAVTSLILLNQIRNMYAADRLYNAGKAARGSKNYQVAIDKLQQAVKKAPNQALFTDELGLAASEVAASLATTDNLKQASEAAMIAVELSNRTLNLNRVHLNFYKTRAKIFINLAQVNPEYTLEALASLDAAIRLSPTDAKLWLNRAMLTDQLGYPEEALKLYQQAVALKPNYDLAHTMLQNLETRLASESAK
jgi:putative inorganic carbon (hco3(-)) transporter